MSHANFSTPAGQPEGAQPETSCRCCSPLRKSPCTPCMWLWILAILIVLIAAGHWWLYGRIYRLPVYRMAMESIQASEELRQALGAPIAAVGWRPPSARLEERENDIRWEIGGPLGRAKAHLHARLMAGNWQCDILEVLLPDGRKISLAENLNKGEEAPLFESPKPRETKPEEKSPPPDITLPTPPDAPQ